MTDGVTLSVRRATLEDVAFLTDVVVEATREQGRLPVDLDEPAWREGFAEWTTEQVLDHEVDSTTYVVETLGQRIGRLRVVRSDHAVEIAGLQLLPAWQSRGLGARVVATVVDEATGRTLTLGVELDNPRARAFWERRGFVATGERDGETVMTYAGSDL